MEESKSKEHAKLLKELSLVTNVLPFYGKSLSWLRLMTSLCTSTKGFYNDQVKVFETLYEKTAWRKDDQEFDQAIKDFLNITQDNEDQNADISEKKHRILITIDDDSAAKFFRKTREMNISN